MCITLRLEICLRSAKVSLNYTSLLPKLHSDSNYTVARAVHFIQKYLVGKTLAAVKAQHDENVFGKVGTSAAEFEKSLTGKKVVDARQQGKYFWYVGYSRTMFLYDSFSSFVDTSLSICDFIS